MWQSLLLSLEAIFIFLPVVGLLEASCFCDHTGWDDMSYLLFSECGTWTWWDEMYKLLSTSMETGLLYIDEMCFPAADQKWGWWRPWDPLPVQPLSTASNPTGSRKLCYPNHSTEVFSPKPDIPPNPRFQQDLTHTRVYAWVWCVCICMLICMCGAHVGMCVYGGGKWQVSSVALHFIYLGESLSLEPRPHQFHQFS